MLRIPSPRLDGALSRALSSSPSTSLAEAVVLVGLLSGCGCQCPQAQAPTAENAVAPPVEPPPTEAPKQEVSKAAEPATVPPDVPPVTQAEPKKEVVEPRFTPGMTVSEAIAAVPPGTEFIGIDREALGRPLSDPKLYQPCKLSASQHFTLKVAVWNGKAVGVDVTSKSKPLSECIHAQVVQVEWPDKVRAINTVDFNY